MKKTEKPLIIPVFIPHEGCPHQCVFCNQNTITGAAIEFAPGAAIEFAPGAATELAPGAATESVTADTVRRIAEEYLGYASGTRKIVEIAFYGGTFLGLPPDYSRLLLSAGQEFVDRGVVTGIRFSTRPDTITETSLDLIKGFSVSTIELGVQSMDDSVLLLSGRGHTGGQGERAALLLKSRGYNLGLQMMTGLPGDSFEKSIETGRRIASLTPDFVRIYPTVVVDQSPLANLYRQGRYTPSSLGETVELVKRLYLIFHKKGIPVIRMGLHATVDLSEGSSLLAGPYHEAFGHLVFSSIFLEMAEKILQEDHPSGSSLVIRVHNSSISKMRGLSNANIIGIKEKYGYKKVSVTPDPSLGKEMVWIEGTSTSFSEIG